MAIVVNDRVSGNLINPGLQLVPVLERVKVVVNFPKGILQNVLGVMLAADTPENKQSNAIAKVLPNLVSANGHLTHLVIQGRSGERTEAPQPAADTQVCHSYKTVIVLLAANCWPMLNIVLR